MASCKDCIQYSVCESADDLQYEDVERLKNDCPRFKNKADFVEVVRCKDCIYYNSNCCFNRQWDLESAKEVPFVRENDFCSYGEKALKEREKE